MKFNSRSGRLFDGLIVMYDLQGFSTFFNQPDVHTYVPIYLNHIIGAIDILLEFKKPYWTLGDDNKPLLCGSIKDGERIPVHRKFLGDGEMFIFDMSKVNNVNDFIIDLMNDFWNISNDFEEVNRKVLDKVPVAQLPTGIRFGLARGSVIELKEAGKRSKEFIGFPINLASRLESYCKQLKLISSARISLPQTVLKAFKYKKVVANNIPGFPSEIVIVDSFSYEKLNKDEREKLFEEI